jgi:uncharacterized membrane protein
MRGPTPEHILSTKRLETLADGVFSIVMTLLVLDIRLPESRPIASANQAILQYIIDLIPRLGIYAIVFLLPRSFLVRASEDFQFHRVW